MAVRVRMHKGRLKQVAEVIVAESHTFDMGDWGESLEERRPIAPSCGWPACIGGWAAYLGLSAGEITKRDFGSGEASLIGPVRKWLGLSRKSANNLFFLGRWPREFRDAYNDASDVRNQLVMAEVAARRIHHLIATGE